MYLNKFKNSTLLNIKYAFKKNKNKKTKTKKNNINNDNIDHMSNTVCTKRAFFLSA